MENQNGDSKIEAVINIAESTLRSTVAITMQDKNRQTLSLGSGVIVGNGLVVTNLHVIFSASFGNVQIADESKKHEIDGVLAFDKANDIALLSVPSIQLKGLELNVNLPKVGDKIFAAGNPQGLSGTFSDGIVSSIRDWENNALIQITAPISPGSSGGPIVNKNAELVGIAVGGFSKGQNLNFAVPAKYINELLKSDRILKELVDLKEAKHSMPTTSNEEIETDLRDFVKIRNIRWSESDPMKRSLGNHLEELSILNKLSYPISNIKIFFIMYDKSGTPVDYNLLTILPSGAEYIMPGLAKTFIGKGDSFIDPLELKLNKKPGFKYEMRLLDFIIHYDL